MPPASMATSTCRGPGFSGSCSSTRRSRAAWMTTVFMGLSSDDRCDQGSSGKMRLEIVAHELAHGVARFHRARGVMRLENDVVERLEPLVDVRLVPEDVETGTLDPLVRQGIEKRRLIDGRTARDVYKDAVRPEAIEHARVDHALGALTTSQGHDQELRTARQFHKIGDERIGQVGSLVDAEIGDIAIETGEAFGDGRPDTSHADDADLLAVDAGHEMHVGRRPAAVADIGIAAR